MYGRHPTISPQSNHRLGTQQIECSPEERVLVLRLTWSRKNIISPFDLCKPSRAKPPCWSLFLPEGRPEFEQAHQYHSDFHPQTLHTLSPLSNHCSKTPSRRPKPYSGVDGRLSLPQFHPLCPSPTGAHSRLCYRRTGRVW